MIFNTVGISLAYQIGAYLPWRQAVLVEAGIMAFIGIATFMLCPESYIWLLMKRREETAR